MFTLLIFWFHFIHADTVLQMDDHAPLSLEELKKTVPEDMMKVYEPQEQVAKTYVGIPVLNFLEKVYGDKLKMADTVVFYCQDGYRADIPLKEFKDKKSLLAYAFNSGGEFSLKGKSGPIALAPFYLVWDQPDAASAEKDVYRWPYAVTRIGVIDSAKVYAPLIEKSVGYGHFMKHCFSCHSINGVGGVRGPPLNPFFASQDDERLVGYILDPKKFNPQSQMSGLSKNLKNRERIAKEIVTYGKKISH